MQLCQAASGRPRRRRLDPLPSRRPPLMLSPETSPGEARAARGGDLLGLRSGAQVGRRCPRQRQCPRQQRERAAQMSGEGC
jgi:hypothetical protein